ncbi:hypothetical protein [Microbacterium sp. Clip185]|uniref:hypothetical protein n=1 Tax=Microbacterium sp. Clip185 TaxID=3025663 RepID=UPI002366B776|nr:hypothetical protein [Microbacterium sp. Clip185]WDG19156.1 hypothetical protein PQV94_05300 [Microbacterium sp. Clip185]
MARPTEFPFVPKTTVSLEVGDVIAIPRTDGLWGALHVVDLRRSGVGSRVSFIAGVLPWRGTHAPTAQDVADMAVVEQALVGTALFREGGFQVTANVPVAPTSLPNNFRTTGIGSSVLVWGWRAAVGRVEAWRPEDPD